MRTNELMTGDLVTFKDCLLDGVIIPIEIMGLGYQHDGLEEEALVRIDNNDSCDIINIDDEIIGIPLTPEILEKNGFKKEGPAQQGGQVWAARYGEKRFRIFEWVASESFVLHDINIRFVHELQHTLRIYGIEKEVIL